MQHHIGVNARIASSGGNSFHQPQLFDPANRNAVHKQKPPGTGKVPGGESCQPLGVIKGL
jgi:hypothetical protein